MPPDFENKEFVLRYLIRYGANVKYTEYLGNNLTYPVKTNALFYICHNGSLSEMELLVKNGADLNKFPKMAPTP